MEPQRYTLKLSMVVQPVGESSARGLAYGVRLAKFAGVLCATGGAFFVMRRSCTV